MNDSLIAEIHHSGRQFVVAITGGGSSTIGNLLRVPGGSQSVLEAVVPYAWSALADWLGGRPDQACAPRTARAMAMAAFNRARKLAEPDVAVDRLLGIGCTASLVSDRPKRGPHRVHLAFQSAQSTRSVSLDLDKGARDRAGEEAFASDFLIEQLAAECGLRKSTALVMLPNDRVEEEQALALPEWKSLLLGDIDRAPGKPSAEGVPAPAQAIFPGAFNPLHIGHQEMVEIASKRLGEPVAFEISIENVDKPPLDYLEIAARVGQFTPKQPCWLTRAPTFVRKSAVFPGATFIVGADTIVRIADPKYYGNDPIARDTALQMIVERGCRFLVFGRTAGGDFRTLDELALPAALRSISTQVPEAEFREDISSTQLRQQAQQQQ